MSYANLKKEIATLPQAAVSEIIDFVRLIKLKYSEKNNLSSRKYVYGVWKNDPFYMSSDFDEPLEDFTEYM